MESSSTKCRIERDDVASLLGAMVEIPSVNPSFQRQDRPAAWFGEAKLAAFILDWLKAEGIEAKLDEASPGRPNVVARLPGPPGAPSMVWEGHTDTVQVEGMDAPFVARVEGDRLYGRGAVDDKACLAMFMLAMRALKHSGVACDLTFVAAVDEEVLSKGVLHHVANHGPYDLAVAGEPTSLAVLRASKGAVRFVVEVNGQGAHASTPQYGVDALLASSDLLKHLDAYMRSTKAAHPLLGCRTLTCTMMQAGEGANTVPAHAAMTFDCRTLPDQTGDEAWQEIAAVVRSFAKAYPSGAEFVINRPFINHPSMETPEDALIVKALSGRWSAPARAPSWPARHSVRTRADSLAPGRRASYLVPAASRRRIPARSTSTSTKSHARRKCSSRSRRTFRAIGCRQTLETTTHKLVCKRSDRSIPARSVRADCSGASRAVG
jgi:acetylornithine deacetylase